MTWTAGPEQARVGSVGSVRVCVCAVCRSLSSSGQGHVHTHGSKTQTSRKGLFSSVPPTQTGSFSTLVHPYTLVHTHRSLMLI